MSVPVPDEPLSPRDGVHHVIVVEEPRLRLFVSGESRGGICCEDLIQ